MRHSSAGHAFPAHLYKDKNRQKPEQSQMLKMAGKHAGADNSIVGWTGGVQPI
jgi:hypothetical protein